MIRKISNIEYQIDSFTEKDTFYTIKYFGGKWICDCPASIHKSIECKHVIRLKMYLNSPTGPRFICPECGTALKITESVDELNHRHEEAVCPGCGYSETR